MVKTKIICTLGPASQAQAILRKMMLAGMDVARLNFSHGTHREHQARLDIIKRLNREYRRHIMILQDLEGYRIRIGKFKDSKPLALKKRQFILLTNKNVLGHGNIVPFDYEGPLKDIKVGSFIYIDDGNISLRVSSSSRDYLKCEVVIAGAIKDGKGVNIPEVKLKFKDLTNKDKLDLEFGIKNKADFIAQSFVRDKDDIVILREFIKKRGFNCRIIAKIENSQGIKNINRILDVADGILVARGDMGVSLPIYEIPVMQKMIIKKCNERKKPVIVATQMLESMTENLRPTRAEVTDVANAILDGTDYVTLSGETTIGKHPVETVRMMNEIIKFTEKNIGNLQRERN